MASNEAVREDVVRTLTTFFDNDPSETIYHSLTEAARTAARDDMGTGNDRDRYEQMLRGGNERWDYEHAVGVAVVEVIREWLDSHEDSPVLQLLREFVDINDVRIADLLGAHYLPTDADEIEWEDEEEDKAERFAVETSGGAPGYTETATLDTYLEAVEHLNNLAADREGKGWTVERGVASRDNFAAVCCTNEADGQGPDGKYISDRYPRTITIQIVKG